MQQYYSIVRNADGTWMIRADGRDVLRCARKSDAVKTAEEANVLAERLAHANLDTSNVIDVVK